MTDETTATLGLPLPDPSHYADEDAERIRRGFVLLDANAAEVTTQIAQAATSSEWEKVEQKPTAFPPDSHGASHRHGGRDEVGIVAPSPHAIPKADATGKLQKGWFPAALTLIGDLVALDTDVVPGGDEVKILPVEGRGLYFFDADATDTPDGESILKPQTGTGRWRLLVPSAELIASELGESAATARFAKRLSERVSSLVQTVEGLDRRHEEDTAALTSAISAVDNRVLLSAVSVSVGSVATGATVKKTVTIAGASVGDVVAVSPSSAVTGIVFYGLVSAKDTVTLVAGNITSAAITVAAQTYAFAVLRASTLAG